MTKIIITILILAALILLLAYRREKSQQAAPASHVHVEFINASDKSVIAVSDMPVDQLPDSFRIDTSLEMAGKKWSVTDAEPADKADFAASGKLRVTLAEITMMAPGDLLFSLPTISNDCGSPVGDTLPHDGLFQIQEDDWRQIEFVSSDQVGQVELELNDIRKIYSERGDGVGFREIHVRERIPTPLMGAVLSIERLRSFFPLKRKFDAVSIRRTPGTIPTSFAWTAEAGPVLWGIASEDRTIVVLCLSPAPCQSELLADGLAKMTREAGVLLVDWCRAQYVTGDKEQFLKYLEPKNKQDANQ
ncbi:MAG: hypothetical protein HS116_05905 [Planctomycetes bacterium]|nr:hypothetical protein [Planctomycetota bacterium]